MALKDRVKKFIPLDLNEENVQAIFNRCLPDASTTEKAYSTLFGKNFGWEDNYAFPFDAIKLSKDSRIITYLFGQVEVLHTEKHYLSPYEGAIKYTGEKWTNDSNILIQLFHLANAACILTPILKETNSASIAKEVLPTLSPKDPKFAEWYEAYEAEMK